MAATSSVLICLLSVVLSCTAIDTHSHAQGKHLWVHIDTWLHIPHSYASVGQAIAVALHDLRIVKKLRVTLGEAQPLYKASWAAARESKVLAGILRVPRFSWDSSSAICPDIVFRAAFPFNFSLPSRCSNSRLLMHATAETGRLWDIMQPHPFVSWTTLGKLRNTAVVTPSNWSASAFVKAGIKAFVVPHGISKHIRAATFAEKQQARKHLGLDSACLQLLTVGAATANKGLPHLLTALSSATHRLNALPADQPLPCIQLVVKAPSAVYEHAEARLRAAVAAVPGHPSLRILFHGATLSDENMAQLYRAADLYITPYSAEGFNMPALEAAASGVPVLATGVGPVPEFLPRTVVRFIKAHMELREGSHDLFPHTCPQGGHCAMLSYARLDEEHLREELAALMAALLHIREERLPSLAAAAPTGCPYAPAACALCLGNTSCVVEAAAWLREVPAAATQLRNMTWGAAARSMLHIAEAQWGVREATG